jgi:hypothetical protein
VAAFGKGIGQPVYLAGNPVRRIRRQLFAEKRNLDNRLPVTMLMAILFNYTSGS